MTATAEQEATKDNTNAHEQSLDKDDKAISRKKLKRLSQLTVSELKQLTDVPEVVEVRKENDE